MKRFRFGLEKVSQLRQYREQAAKEELGQAIGALAVIENKIKQNAVSRHHAVQERFADINTKVHSMTAWNDYIGRLEQEAEYLSEEAAAAELVVEEKRNQYLEASRELKVMENLREKQEKECRKEVFDAETKELDDMWRSPEIRNQAKGQ